MKTRATFTSFQESTPEDWQLLRSEYRKFSSALPDRVLAHLELLRGDHGGFPVDRLQHSLQTATFALRDGRDEEYVVCALVHDIGDSLCSFNHPDLAAAMVKPFVSEANHWMVQHHGIFQGYYFWHHIGADRHARDEFKGHPHYERTAEFCELYDSVAFNPSREILPLGEFEPMVRRVFGNPKRSLFRGLDENAQVVAGCPVAAAV